MSSSWTRLLLFCRVAGGRLSLSRKPEAAKDAVVETDVGTFRGLVMKQKRLGDVVRGGQVKLTGDRDRLDQLLRAVAV